MTKFLYALIVALVLALGGTAWYAREQAYAAAGAAQKAKDTQTQLDATADALATSKADAAAARKLALDRLRQLETSKAQERVTAKALNEAYLANPEWAGTVVPDGVRKSISRKGSAG